MIKTDDSLEFALVARGDLGAVLRATSTPVKRNWSPDVILPRLAGPDVLVVWDSDSPRPCAIATSDNGRLELFNWAASYHSDLSPLSSWCHVLAYEELRRLLSGKLSPELHRLEAAWTGAIIAEASTLTRRSYEDLSLLTCLATDGYLVGRLAALYGPDAGWEKKLEGVYKAQERLRRPTPRRRWPMQVIWKTLLSLMPGAVTPASRQGRILRQACSDLNRTTQDEEKAAELGIETIEELAAMVPQLLKLRELPQMPAEDRVIFLRELRDQFQKLERKDAFELMPFAAGYIISRIGGGQRDLRLADTFENYAPDVLGWAATLGGLGGVPSWTDAYNGLGRLVSRELMRPFHISDPPTADGAAEEVMVIVELDRSATRSRIRTAQKNVAALSSLPGVVAYLPITEDDRDRARSVLASPTTLAPSPSLPNYDQSNLRSLAEHLWPFLRPLLETDLNKRNKYRKKSEKTGERNPSLLRDEE